MALLRADIDDQLEALARSDKKWARLTLPAALGVGAALYLVFIFAGLPVASIWLLTNVLLALAVLHGARVWRDRKRQGLLAEAEHLAALQPPSVEPARLGDGTTAFSLWSGLRGVVWDWGDTLMKDIPGQPGPMADWPEVEAMPGALSALRALATIGIQCVATNAEESGEGDVAAALDRVGLRMHLAKFFTSGELGVSKPDPDFYREVARRLGVPANELVMVGNDYTKDIEPAKAAGMRTVLVTQQPPPTGVDAADLMVENLEVLAGLVSG